MRKIILILLGCIIGTTIGLNVADIIGDDTYYYESGSLQKQSLEQPFRDMAKGQTGLVYLNIKLVDGQDELSYEISSGAPDKNDTELFSSKKVFLIAD